MEDIRNFGVYPTNTAAANKTAVQAAINAKLPWLEWPSDVNGASFPIDAGITLNNKTKIVGNAKLVTDDTNNAIFIANGISGFEIQGLSGQGSAVLNHTNTYPDGTNTFQSFIKIINCDAFRVGGLNLDKFGGWTIDYQDSSQLGSAVAKGLIEDVNVTGSFIGLTESNLGEYLLVSNFTAEDCKYGIYCSGGNNRHTNGKITHCYMGVHVDGGATQGNGAHGAFSNFSINHNNTNMRCLDVLLGQEFTGCEFLGGYATPATNFGIILISGSRGVRINGGSICSAITVNNSANNTSGMNQINDALFRTEVAGFPTPVYTAGMLSIKDCISPTAISPFNN